MHPLPDISARDRRTLMELYAAYETIYLFYQWYIQYEYTMVTDEQVQNMRDALREDKGVFPMQGVLRSWLQERGVL